MDYKPFAASPKQARPNGLIRDRSGVTLDGETFRLHLIQGHAWLEGLAGRRIMSRGAFVRAFLMGRVRVTELPYLRDPWLLAPHLPAPAILDGQLARAA